MVNLMMLKTLQLPPGLALTWSLILIVSVFCNNKYLYIIHALRLFVCEYPLELLKTFAAEFTAS